MPTPTFGASNLQWVGVATELVPGTAIANPTTFFPCDTPSWVRDIDNLTDTALRGGMGAEYQQVKGLRRDTVTFKTNLYLDSVFVLLRAALGLPDVVSGTTNGTVTTTLAASSLAGATTLSLTATCPNGTVLQIDNPSTGQSEIRTTSGLTGSGPYTVTVAAMTYAHANAAPAVSLNAAVNYNHKTSLQSANNGQPQTTTVFFNDAQGKTWQMPYSQIVDLKLTFAIAGLCTAEVTYMGLGATAITPPTNTPTTSKPMPSWNSTITLGGTAHSDFAEIDLEIKRDTASIDTMTGTQQPFAIYAGGVSVSGSFKSVYQGSTDVNLVNELNNTQPVLLFKTAPVGDAINSITIQCSAVTYDATPIDGGSKYMMIGSTIKCLSNPTDVAALGNQSPMLVTLVSPVTTLI